MLKGKFNVLLVGLLASSSLFPALVDAGSIKKTYINVAKEGQKAQANDLPSGYGSIGTAFSTKTYEAASGVHGQLVKTGLIDGPATSFGKAMTFNDGTETGSYMKSYPVPTSFPTTKMTVESWIKPGTRAPDSYFASFASSGGYNSLLLGITPSMVLTIHIADSNYIVTNVVLEQGKWSHFAITWESSTGMFKVYKNGNATPVYQTTFAKNAVINNSNGSFMLGQEQDCAGGCFEVNQRFIGAYDDFRVWNVVRTGEQIAKNFNNPLKSTESGLVLNFNFE